MSGYSERYLCDICKYEYIFVYKKKKKMK